MSDNRHMLTHEHTRQTTEIHVRLTVILGGNDHDQLTEDITELINGALAKDITAQADLQINRTVARSFNNMAY